MGGVWVSECKRSFPPATGGQVAKSRLSSPFSFPPRLPVAVQFCDGVRRMDVMLLLAETYAVLLEIDPQGSLRRTAATGSETRGAGNWEAQAQAWLDGT